MKITSANTLTPGKPVYLTGAGLTTSIAHSGIVNDIITASTTIDCVVPISTGVTARVRSVNPVIVDVIVETNGVLSLVSSTITGANATTSYNISLSRITATTYLLLYCDTSNNLNGMVLTYNTSTYVFSPGTNVLIEAVTVYNHAIAPLSTQGIFFVTYGKSNGYGYSRIVTVVGTAISMGALLAVANYPSYSAGYSVANALLSDTKAIAMSQSGTTMCFTTYTISGNTLTRLSTNNKTDAAYVTTSSHAVYMFKYGTDRLVVVFKKSTDNELYIGFIETATTEPVFYTPVKLTSDGSASYTCSGTVYVDSTTLDVVWANSTLGKYMRITCDAVSRTASISSQSPFSRLYRYNTTPKTGTLAYNTFDNHTYFATNTSNDVGNTVYKLFKINPSRVTETTDVFVGVASGVNTVLTKGVISGLTGLIAGATYGINPVTGALFTRSLAMPVSRSIYGGSFATAPIVLPNVELVAISSTQLLFTNSDYPY